MNCSGLIRTMLPAVLFAGPALAQDVPNAALVGPLSGQDGRELQIGDQPLGHQKVA